MAHVLKKGVSCSFCTSDAVCSDGEHNWCSRHIVFSVLKKFTIEAMKMSEEESAEWSFLVFASLCKEVESAIIFGPPNANFFSRN